MNPKVPNGPEPSRGHDSHMRGVASLNLEHEERAVPAWFAWSTPPVPAEEILSSAEMKLYEALSSEKRRLAFLQGRSCAKEALSFFQPDHDSDSPEIVSGVFGQPVVRGGTGDLADVSISHSHGLAVAIAFARGYCLGVDIEYVSAESPTFVLDQLTHRENQTLGTTNCDVPETCRHIWTAKEALSKALKCGMTVPLDVLELSEIEFAESGAELRSGFSRFSQYRAQTWSVGRYVLAVVLPRNTAMHFDPRKIPSFVKACGYATDL